MTPETAAPAIPTDWQPIVSGNAELKLTPVAVGKGSALRLDFDFKGAGGFVVARRALSRPMPSEYAIKFRLRGHGPANNLELKLVDESGLNVWRHVEKDLRPPARWQRRRVASQDIDFAWGPASGSGITQLGSLEFAIVAGEGGKGTLWLADVDVEDCTPQEPPHITASSEESGFAASQAIAGRGWKPRSDDRKPWLVIDSRQLRTLGGLVIDWLNSAPAAGFRVQASMNGRRWKTLHATARAGGARSYVYLPALKTRYLRLELSAPTGALLTLQAFDFSRSIHAFWQHLAAAETRGWHPRWLHREQSLWTPVGTSHGTHCALMNDDGMVEAGQGSFSIEPMLWVGGRLVTWADVTATQALSAGYLPVPTVVWETRDWRLSIRAEATVSRELRVRYRFENLTGGALSAYLYAALRPFQVTPPWQNFRQLGGVSPIKRLVWREGAVWVDECMQLQPLPQAEGFGALGFDDGFLAAHLTLGQLPAAVTVDDSFGFASGALAFDVSVGPQGSCEKAVHCVPLSHEWSLGAAPAVRRPLDEPAFDWGAALAVNQWAGNGWMAEVIHTALTATAHVLVTRAGPALQPGPRRYTRSWIRDGAMMSAALLRMRHADEVREFIRWYAPNQRADGFVPCCVDSDGVDWLVEHDSHGQLIALIADYHRFTRDRPFLEECWEYVVKAVECIERLLGADGLLPISVSHEGYLAQPVHSFWDDFWALRGLGDAADMACLLGREQAQPWRELTTRFAASLYAAIEATRARRGLDFIPGSIEWADFDPTATANALYLLDIPQGLERRAIDRTFDLYFTEWRRKRDGSVPSANYTPYEIRIIGALVRLGWRDRALELLRFFLSDRRPVTWNQWPEIAWRDARAPAHIGDLPHTWIAAEYVLVVRCLFAYEREQDACLVVGAGLASEWIDGPGVRVQAMPTLYGDLSYSLRRVDRVTLRFDIGGIGAAVLLRPPLTCAIVAVTVDAVSHADFDAGSVTLTRTPAQVVCTLSDGVPST